MIVTNGITTDVLRGDLNDNENVRWLYQRFIGELNSFVERRISAEYRRRVDGQAISDTSFRQALERAKGDPDRLRTSETFRGLLYCIARREIVDQIEWNSTGGRTIKQETDLGDAFENISVSSTPFSPAQKLSIDEVMRRVISELLQESDQVRMLINVLGVGLELNANAIAEILTDLPHQPRVPSLPTIRLQIARARERVRQYRNDLPDVP